MKKFRKYLFLILSLSAANVFAQVKFTKTYGFGPINDGRCVIQTSDLGYAVCGTTTPSSGGQTNFYLLKTDSMGIPSFQYSYGAQGIDQSFALVQLADSGFILAGYSNSFSGNSDYDVYIVRTDKLGNLLWEKSMGTSGWDFIFDMKATIDGNYILAGNSFGSSSVSSGYIVKIDPSGNLIWQKFIDMNQVVNLKRIAVRNDGSFVVCGNISNTSDYPADGFVAFLDSNGDTTRTVTFDNGKHESINGLGFFSNGDLALGGSSIDAADSNNVDEMILRMDSNGSTLWVSVFPSTGSDQFNDVVVQNDTLLYAGSTTTFGGGNADFHFLKFDSNGGFISGGNFGDEDDDICYHAALTNDLGYILVGSTKSYGPGQQSILLIKLDSLLQFNNTVVIDVNEIQQTNLATVYPNPSSGLLKINSEKSVEKINYRLFDMNGKIIIENYSTEMPFEINVDGIKNGFYNLELTGKNFIERKKVVILN